MNEPAPLRDLLLRRHEASRPQLDRARHAAIAGLPLPWTDFVAAVFRPHRSAWWAFLLIWALLCAHQATLRLSPTTPPPAPLPPEAVAAGLKLLQPHETLAQVDRSR
jgi:hypothetical protein